jgi:hypothetical protein
MCPDSPADGRLPVPNEVEGVQTNSCRSPRYDNYGKGLITLAEYTAKRKSILDAL